MVLVSLPLMEKESTFHLFQVVKLSISYPGKNKEKSVIAKLKLKTQLVIRL